MSRFVLSDAVRGTVRELFGLQIRCQPGPYPYTETFEIPLASEDSSCGIAYYNNTRPPHTIRISLSSRPTGATVQLYAQAASLAAQNFPLNTSAADSSDKKGYHFYFKINSEQELKQVVHIATLLQKVTNGKMKLEEALEVRL
ncbi:MAG TPA: hypothetical protein VJJ82_05730 [Candidatus Nanoarchaeia archaeon]|nr:hypothetical protein [Candidatus Nanoarchaeia archaeon]